MNRQICRRAVLNGIDVTYLQSATGASAVVADHGAHLLSWCPAGGTESLFLSKKARFGANDAIRGGVPVIFPQFGERGTGKRHGIARSQVWDFLGATQENGSVLAKWQLTGTLCMVAESDQRFLLTYEVRLGSNTIDLGLVIENVGANMWSCQAALHTYLRVDDLDGTSVYGLQEGIYVDQTQDGATARQDCTALRFTAEVDRIYVDPPSRLLMCDGRRRLWIEQQGFTDTVTWNPGFDKAAEMADLPVSGYENFICVEAAAVMRHLVLAPGSRWCGSQTLEV